MTRLIPRARAAVAAGAAGLVAAGCNTDNILKVSTPDIVQPGAVQTVTALPTVFNSAVGEFANAFSGNTTLEGVVLYGGLIGDEFLLSDTFDTRRQIDSRNILRDNANNDAVYRQLHRARVAAERASAAYASLAPNTQASQSEALSLAGYTYVLFAEDYCSGVPFSSINPDGTVKPGAPQSTAQILAIASAKFDTALAVATAVGKAAASQAYLAQVGKARALLDLGQYAAAATVAANVPTSFQYLIYSSTNSAGQNNGIWFFNRSNRRFSAADKEGGNGLPYRSDNDPRVLTVYGNGQSKVGFDGSPLYVVVKYSEQNSSTVLASGVEAQLIQAEAAAQPALQSDGGDFSAALAILNALRANTSLYACPTGVTLTNFTCPTTTPTLAPLTDPGTAAARLQLLFKERAYWLYVTGHRLGDMRRLARTPSSSLSGYGLGAANVYPVGAYTPQPGATYGTNTSLPASLFDQNDPLFTNAQCDNVTP